MQKQKPVFSLFIFSETVCIMYVGIIVQVVISTTQLYYIYMIKYILEYICIYRVLYTYTIYIHIYIYCIC